jgi:hypothetical protein
MYTHVHGCCGDYEEQSTVRVPAQFEVLFSTRRGVALRRDELTPIVEAYMIRANELARFVEDPSAPVRPVVPCRIRRHLCVCSVGDECPVQASTSPNFDKLYQQGEFRFHQAKIEMEKGLVDVALELYGDAAHYFLQALTADGNDQQVKMAHKLADEVLIAWCSLSSGVAFVSSSCAVVRHSRTLSR